MLRQVNKDHRQGTITQQEKNSVKQVLLTGSQEQVELELIGWDLSNSAKKAHTNSPYGSLRKGRKSLPLSVSKTREKISNTPSAHSRSISTPTVLIPRSSSTPIRGKPTPGTPLRGNITSGIRPPKSSPRNNSFDHNLPYIITTPARHTDGLNFNKSGGESSRKVTPGGNSNSDMVTPTAEGSKENMSPLSSQQPDNSLRGRLRQVAALSNAGLLSSEQKGSIKDMLLGGRSGLEQAGTLLDEISTNSKTINKRVCRDLRNIFATPGDKGQLRPVPQPVEPEMCEKSEPDLDSQDSTRVELDQKISNLVQLPEVEEEGHEGEEGEEEETEECASAGECECDGVNSSEVVEENLINNEVESDEEEKPELPPNIQSLTYMEDLLWSRIPRGSFVIFDLDETLIMTRGAPSLMCTTRGARRFQQHVAKYPVSLKEKNLYCKRLNRSFKDKILIEGSTTTNVVSSLQRAGCCIFGLTTRFEETAPGTHKTLRSLGVDMTLTSPFPPQRMEDPETGAVYENGVIYCNGEDKGLVLNRFLENVVLFGPLNYLRTLRMRSNNHIANINAVRYHWPIPPGIYYVDDRVEHCHSLNTRLPIAPALGIPVHCYLYLPTVLRQPKGCKHIEKWGDYGPSESSLPEQILRVQFDHFIRNDLVLSNTESLKIVRRMSAEEREQVMDDRWPWI